MTIPKDPNPKIGLHSPSASILSNQPRVPKQDEKTTALFQRITFEKKREINADVDPKITAKKEIAAKKLDHLVKQPLNRL